MERETRMLLWTLFGIGVLTVAFLPAAWTSLNHDTAIGVVSNTNMAQALWGQSPSVPAYVTGWASDTRVPIIPGAVEAHVESVLWDTSIWGPQLVISGYGFGNPPPPGKASLTIADQSRGWVAGNAPTFGVQPVITLWRNDRIVVSGWSGYGESDGSNWSDGQGSWVFAPGDSLVVSVTNPQTENVGTFGTQYPMNAPMPTVSLHTIPTIVAGQSIDLTGQVIFQGHPLSNQAVSVSVSSGTLGGTAYASNPTEHLVYTDGSGNFYIPYSSPSGGGIVNVTTMADAVSVTGTVTILEPKLVLKVDVPTQTAVVGTNYAVRGRLTSNGQPLANQTVTLAATGGDVSPATVTTDEFGNFASTYTAASSPGTYTVSATSLGAGAKVTVTVASILFSGPITAGMPAIWSGNWASHMYLTQLPEDAQVLATNGSEPTAVYFRYGNGQVFVDTQTVEFYFNSASWATTEWNNIIRNYVLPSSKPILLLNDGTNWGQNQAAVNAMESAVPSATVSYLTQASIPNMAQYGVIVVNGVQASYFANNLEQMMPELNQWIQNGGTLIFDSTDQANSGVSWRVGPDGISNVWDLAAENDLVADVTP